MKIILLCALFFLSLTKGQVSGRVGRGFSLGCESRVELVQIPKGTSEATMKEIMAYGKQHETRIKGLKRANMVEKTIVIANGNCCWYFYSK